MALNTRHHLGPRLSVGRAIAMLPFCGCSAMVQGEGYLYLYITMGRIVAFDILIFTLQDRRGECEQL
jgi:hypothetical protein